MPAHTHPVNVSVSDLGHSHSTNTFQGVNGTTRHTNYFQPLENADSTNSVTTSAEHTGIQVTATTTSTGSGTDYYPPYYILIFIIKYQ